MATLPTAPATADISSCERVKWALDALAPLEADPRIEGEPAAHVRTAIAALRAANALHTSLPPTCETPPAPVARVRHVVLVAEDQAELRELMVRLLRRDYHVITASDGAEALALATDHRPDAAVLDVMMPERDGMDVVRVMRANPTLARIPVVLVTAKAQPQDIVDGLEAGADDYLTKPFRADELRARIRSVLRKSGALAAESRAREAAESRAEQTREVLHNVGNVLSSAGVAAAELRRLDADSRLAGLQRLAELMTQHAHDLPGFFATDPRAAAIPEYLGRVAASLGSERAAQQAESGELMERLGLMQRLLLRPAAAVTGVVDLAVVARDALAVSGPSLRAAEVQVVTDLEPCEVTGDRDELGQVLLNLVKNAREALDGASERRLALVLRSGPQVVLTVTDTGQGIDPTELVRIFERGVTTRSRGSGIGLHYCARVVARLGGTLTAASEGPGAGSTFTLTLPARGGTP